MSPQHRQHSQNQSQTGSSLSGLVALCSLAVVSGTIGAAGVLAYVRLSWAHYEATVMPSLEESISAADVSENSKAGIPTGVALKLTPANALRPQPAIAPTDEESIATSPRTYATDVLPLVSKHGVDEVWFENLCHHWAAFSGQTWAAMTETEKAEFANELLFRLKEGLHPATLRQLGRRNTLHYSNLTWQREQAGQPKEIAHDKADARFFAAFPNLRQYQSEISHTGFDEVWFAFLEDVIRERTVPVYREEVASTNTIAPSLD
ncbi:MAG: hypothetical protein ACFBSF_05485 [Leptolyngbyaceae cyanobacterium]